MHEALKGFDFKRALNELQSAERGLQARLDPIFAEFYRSAKSGPQARLDPILQSFTEVQNADYKLQEDEAGAFP
jgi:hypothetical protein